MIQWVLLIATFGTAAWCDEWDLIDGLELHNRTYQGIDTDEDRRTLRMRGDVREAFLPPAFVRGVGVSLSRSRGEVTFLATVRQEPGNTGTLLAIALQTPNRLVELQSSGRRDEIRLRVSNRLETFPFRLADGAWHRVAVGVSGGVVSLRVDCSPPLYTRAGEEPPWDTPPAELWIGQRNSRHFLFKGSMRDVKIVTGPHGYQAQCPNADTECPTCGQFRHLQSAVHSLEREIRMLTQRLSESERRLASVGECECHKSCSLNGTTRPDGATWRDGCQMCSCTHGQVQCSHVGCPAVHCKHPVAGECCPQCLRKCLFDNVLYDHGEKTSPVKCATCECINGSMRCRRMDPLTACPPLPCPEEEQFSTPDECCHFCPGTDYCGFGHSCHRNASCTNLKTHYTCQCNAGFHGDGTDCQDVDECLSEGDPVGHHCHLPATCHNTLGGYECRCPPGYEHTDKYNCRDVDECVSGDVDCPGTASCFNTPGGYECRCMPGYEGPDCEPVCRGGCGNGGVCVSPDICACSHGYTGIDCRQDVDECSWGLDECLPPSHCVNMPGWYYCECLPGYAAHHDTCTDVDECSLGLSTCDPSVSFCVNDDGDFHCECHNDTRCSPGCVVEGVGSVLPSGSSWSSGCSACSCDEGVVRCEPLECNCAQDPPPAPCCPHCHAPCEGEEPPRRSGERWETHDCLTCECLDGEVDCWRTECPPGPSLCPLRPGECCPRCPDLDPCQGGPKNESMSCAFRGVVYTDGEATPPLTDTPCATCACKVSNCQQPLVGSDSGADSCAARSLALALCLMLMMML